MPSGLQVWSGEANNKLLVDITGRMLNMVGSFRIPIYIYATNGWNGTSEIPTGIVSGTYTLPKSYSGDLIFIPSYDDPNFIEVVRGASAAKFNYDYASGERIYVPPDCSLSAGIITWAFDRDRIRPCSDYNCVAFGGFTVNVGFY